MDGHGFLINTLIYLFAAVLAVLVSKRLGLGSVLGYLLAGVAIGPWGLGLITGVEEILHFSEFGVVLLLFLVGLELEPRRLWTLRRSILGAGGLQVVVTAIVLAAAALALGWHWNLALIAGMGLALSSTAIALQTLTEKHLLSTPAGRTGFSILLFQDIAVIAMIALIPLLGAGLAAAPGTSPWLAAGKALGVIAAIIVVGRFALRYVFQAIAGTGLREIFTAFSLLLVFGIAALMDMVGLSMALGTFLAGVLLADSEYRHALVADIEPFKGLLMGLFFISVGMSVNFGLLVQEPGPILALALGLVAVKSVVLFALAPLFDVPARQRPLFAFVLSQGGEFAFVLFSFAVASGALSDGAAHRLVLVVALSMATTPLLMLVSDRFTGLRSRRAAEPPAAKFERQGQAVIIIGFGRFGQVVNRMLNANGIATTVIDHDPDNIERVRRYGNKAYYGDALRLDVLRAAGAGSARLIVLALNDRDASTEAARRIGKAFPNARLAVRAWDRVQALDFIAMGIEDVTRDTFYSALKMGEDALRGLGFTVDEAHTAMQTFEHHDIKTLLAQVAVRDDEAKMISLAKRARVQIEQTLAADRAEPDLAPVKD